MLRLHSSVLLALLSVLASAQPAEEREAAWVFFSDKSEVDAALAIRELEATYGARAIDRRRLRRTAPGLFDERDFPLAAEYVQAVVATGAELRVESTWLNAISVSARPGELARIADLPFVDRVQPVRALEVLEPCAPPVPPTAPQGASGFYGFMDAQLDQIGLVDLHAAGFTGEGVIVGVLDTGFRRTHDAYTFPGHALSVVAEFDFVENDGDTGPDAGDPPGQFDHGTYILGTIGAYEPNVLVGGAYDAAFVLAKVEDITDETAVEEDWFVAGLQLIEANGGDVATSSVIARNYDASDLDGLTAVMTLGFNTATENGLHCFQGAGNEGHDANPATGNLLVPADAHQVITVGAVSESGTIASFSSDGPTVDGRLKPEVLARGVFTRTTDPNDDSGVTSVSGTSLSTPLTAAAAACLVQAHPDWTVNQMRNALFHTAEDWVANGEPDPLLVRGYGIIDSLAASQWSEPLVYCAAKRTSAGCLPTIGAQGAASVTAPLPFHVTVELAINQQFGTFFYGLVGPAEAPFQGGILCVQMPVQRTPVQLSTGNPPPADCSGRFTFDFNAWLQAGMDLALVTGVQVNGQYWFRDPAAGSGSGLSDAIQFTIQP